MSEEKMDLPETITIDLYLHINRYGDIRPYPFDISDKYLALLGKQTMTIPVPQVDLEKCWDEVMRSEWKKEKVALVARIEEIDLKLERTNANSDSA